MIIEACRCIKHINYDKIYEKEYGDSRKIQTPLPKSPDKLLNLLSLYKTWKTRKRSVK